MDEDRIINKLEEHDKRFDEVDKKLTDHDEKFDIIVRKLLEHDHQFVLVRKEIAELRQDVMRGQDAILTILHRLDARSECFDR